MKRARRTAILAVLAAGCLAAAGVTAIATHGTATAAPAHCQLGNDAGQIEHVIYLQFDNTHYNRDNPSVASDLEQMPNLLDFLKSNGTLFTNDHTILISHTAGGILSSLTGLYPDRNGQTVSNSYFAFDSGGTPRFSTSFKYWTDKVDDANGTFDPLPNMVTDNGKTTPAPWVPFTRAGCDVGGVGTANIELENTGTGAFGDMTQAFGAGSPEWNEAKAAAALTSNDIPDPLALARAKGLPQTDFVGIAIHCALVGSSLCTNDANARPDLLPDEPLGYSGKALFGAKYVDPAITGGNPCVDDTSGQPITDPSGTCGFPGFDGMLAKNTLGYVGQMQENGVPVTYAYISDAHDFHVPNPLRDAYDSSAQGPGENDFQTQLRSYDLAFKAFFDGLASHGIDKSNTLFVVTVDEGDHFAGGVGTPDPAHADALKYTHASCPTNAQGILVCPSNQIGEVNANLRALLNRTDFAVHSDSAPTFYVNGNPAAGSDTVRSLEHAVAGLQLSDPYVDSGTPHPIVAALADPIEEKALHMVNADPARTPTFTLFGNPDFFFTASATGPTCGSNPCVSPGFAWSHGDLQDEIANTWVGFVGPGVAQNGVDGSTWTDHTNVRPTILSLLGLHDDYGHDGRVLTEGLTTKATPQSLIAHRETVRRLSAIYEQVNAPFGQFAHDTLTASTKGILSTSAGDATYASTESQIATVTTSRDALATEIKKALDGAAFDGQPLNEKQAKDWIDQAQSLIDRAHALATSS